jgi:serine/threonine-protein kinase
VSSRENARRFHFIREIASGGFGTVFLTKVMHADGFSRLVAVKLLKAQWSETEEVARRMRDEARLLGLLRHRNIVDVIDLTSIDGRSAVVMEYLEAVDLRAVTQELAQTGGRLPVKAALEVIAAVAGALDAAYNRPPIPGEKPLRVIHRDIKPSNVMVDETGLVKVLDFGVARSELENRESHTQELQFGSVDYMAPERLFFEPETPASDVYSLGATLFEILGLEKLGKARGRPDKHAAFVNDRLSFLRGCVVVPPTALAELGRLIEASLSFNHEERPTAAAFQQRARALSRLVDDEDLTSWAERVIPPLVARAQRESGPPSPLADTVVTEDVSGLPPEETEAPVPPDRGAVQGAALQRGALAELDDSEVFVPTPATGAPSPRAGALAGWDEPATGPAAVRAPRRDPERPLPAAPTAPGPADPADPFAMSELPRKKKPVSPVDSALPVADGPLPPLPAPPGVTLRPLAIRSRVKAKAAPAPVVLPAAPMFSSATIVPADDLDLSGDGPPTGAPAGRASAPLPPMPAPPSGAGRSVALQPPPGARPPPPPAAAAATLAEEFDQDDFAATVAIVVEPVRPPARGGSLLPGDDGDVESTVPMVDEAPVPPLPLGRKAQLVQVTEEAPEPPRPAPRSAAPAPAAGAPPGSPARAASAPAASAAASPPPDRAKPAAGKPPGKPKARGPGLFAVVAGLGCFGLVAVGGVGFGYAWLHLDALQAAISGATGGALAGPDGAGTAAGPAGELADEGEPSAGLDAGADGAAPGEGAGGDGAAAAGPGDGQARFRSAAADTKRVKVVCGDVRGEGASEVVIAAAEGAKCTVTAVLTDRSRLTATVAAAGPGDWVCFDGGAEACARP